MSRFGYTCEKCHTVIRLTDARAIEQRAKSIKGRMICDPCLKKTGLKIPDAQIKAAIAKAKTRTPSASKNRARDEAGVTVTCRNQTNGMLLTIHRPGLVWQSLRAVCRNLDKMDGEWLIVAISTPRTIVADLKGRADPERRHEGDAGDPGMADYEIDARAKIEKLMLAKIGRVDLLEPTPKPRVYGYPRTSPGRVAA